jgi:uncharacterized protein (TIGR01777 family)
VKIAVTGSSGLIGNAIVQALEARGDSVLRMRRGVHWDPEAETIDLAALEGQEAIVHLAGETIAGLWTRKKKRRILESREKGTRLLATSLGNLAHPPKVFVSASAIGYYGDRPSVDAVDESAPRGAGFLADVTEVWERASDPARAAGVRVVNPRFGIVLSRDGGAFALMLPLFRLGLGGRLGSGRQMWSWVALDDVVAGVLFCIDHPEIEGPVNIVAPQPVSNLAFTRTVGRVLARPTIFGVPSFLLRTVVGQMADEMLLFGVRVVPRKLQNAGYEFRYPELEVALRHLLAPA